MNALITAAASAQAYTIKALLGNETDVFLGDHLDLPALMLQSGKLVKTPNAANNAFAHSVLSFCLDKQIAKVYPLRSAELLPLAEARQLFTEYGVYVCVPGIDVIKARLKTQSGKMSGPFIVENGLLVAGNAIPENFVLPADLRDGIFGINLAADIQLFTAD